LLDKILIHRLESFKAL